MLKWTAFIAALLVCLLVLFSFAKGQSLRRASLLGGKNQLLVAYRDYTNSGHIANQPLSGYQVWLSTNVVTIDGTEYHCFAEVGGGWGYDGGRLTMTTNQIFIWLDTERPP
ncbi:MAG: hypothetical protein ABIV39_14060, partial [Verrucomicrobiota bacterium]